MRCSITTVALVSLIMTTSLFAADSVTINFSHTIREWDGFGVNYVETRHTRDYEKFPQDYGGFKYLSETDREKVIDMVFGEEGIKPAMIKMFLDPFHEPVNDNDNPLKMDMTKFDHKTTTKWIRYFAQKGNEKTKSWGGKLSVLAGLYGPPGWMTWQKTFRGRDMDESLKEEIAEYLVSWAKFIQDSLNLNVTYMSMHNEGEHQVRWHAYGRDKVELYHHDYNMWWKPYQIVDFLKYGQKVLHANGMHNVKMTTGETTRWDRLHKMMNYDSVIHFPADLIKIDPEAMSNLGLITSHGFILREGHFMSNGVDSLRQKNPNLHAWTTSCTWDGQDVNFVERAQKFIYTTKVNGIIPWAICHNDYESDKLNDPAGMRVSGNAESPFKTNDGKLEILKTYYYFKQLSRAGQPGMAVVPVSCTDSSVLAIGFHHNNTRNKDAFILMNLDQKDRPVNLRVVGCETDRFDAYITSDASFKNKNYESLGTLKLKKGSLAYTIPARSAITFFGK